MKPRTGRRRRVVRVVGAVFGVLVITWAVWAYAVIQTPRVDRAGPVDAVLVLGGLDGNDRTERALQLVRDGLTDTVVLSIPVGSTDALAKQTCADPPSGVEVVCFRPDPSTTRGEAQELGRLASDRDWSRVAVVTSTFHVSRSRMIVGRCFTGTLLMVQSRDSISPWEWAYQWLYQTAGYAKAEILRGC